MLNLFIFFFYYFVILFSIIGYGYLIQKIFKWNFSDSCFGYLGITGAIGIIIYSYLINYFFGHEKIFNLFLILVGLIFFYFFLKKDFFNKKKDLIALNLIFLVIFLGVLIQKNHDDFHYYHFPYTLHLIEQKLIIGTGIFSQGFRTPSSIFYFNSNLHLPLAEFGLFNFFAAYILGFSNIILLRNIFKLNNDYYNTLSLLCFIFINIFFYRISEHGTDRSALILIFIYLIEILKFINDKNFNKQRLSRIYLLLSLIISLKSFYFLYTIFLIPLFVSKINLIQNLTKFLQNFIVNKSLILALPLSVLVLMSYFLNTSCFIYPVSLTCLDNVKWALGQNDVITSHNWFQLWSKAGATPNFTTNVDDRLDYITNFNWVNNWFKEYFFTKVSDFLLGVFLICLIIYSTFKKLMFKFKRSINKKYLLILFIIFILIIEWFYNHPALRYGGYSIIALFYFIILNNFLNQLRLKKKTFYVVMTFLVTLSLTVFIFRNINRINYEINTYNYKPFTNPYYVIDERHFRIQENIVSKLVKKYNECPTTSFDCDKISPNISKIFGYYLLYK